MEKKMIKYCVLGILICFGLSTTVNGQVFRRGSISVNTYYYSSVPVRTRMHRGYWTVMPTPMPASYQTYQAPRQEAPRQEAPRQEAPRQEAPRQEAPRQEAPIVESDFLKSSKDIGEPLKRIVPQYKEK